MKEVFGRPIIDYLLNRVRSMSAIDRVVVATSTDGSDDRIAAYCGEKKADCFRGSPDDVLSRMLHCAQRYGMDRFVRFSGDSPLIDVYIADGIITQYFLVYEDIDYLSNNHPSTYPEGMQLEIVRTESLRTAAQAPDLTDADSEHGTRYIWTHPEQFTAANITADEDTHTDYRFVLDYPEDWQQIKAIIQALFPSNPLFSLSDMKNFLDTHPQIKALNSNRYTRSQSPGTRVFKVQ